MSDQLPSPVYTKKESNGWSISVKVQPGAKKTESTGEADSLLRIRLSAPAVDNKANKALLVFLAAKLGLRLSRVRLISGEKSRQKRVLIESETEPNWRLLD